MSDNLDWLCEAQVITFLKRRSQASLSFADLAHMYPEKEVSYEWGGKADLP